MRNGLSFIADGVLYGSFKGIRITPVFETEKKKKEFKPIVETIKEPLEFEFEIMGLKEMTGDQAKASAQKLVDLDARDEAKKAQEMALNNLESQVIDMKVKLYEDIYEKSTTEEEREKILAKCQELSDWIDEEATVDTEVDVLEGKLKELTDLTVSLHARVKQHKERPEALEAMNNMVNSSQHFLGKAKNSTGVVDGYFTQEELDKLEKKNQRNYRMARSSIKGSRSPTSL